MIEVFKDKKVLILGGAGSIGLELTKRVLNYDPKTIRIFDISENQMFKSKNIFSKEENVRYLIGDIRDRSRLELAMDGIDIVINLAAMKHVYACEYNPFEAIKTNIYGLQNVIDCAKKENVEKMIFSSTDKAAKPSNVMGMTKLLGEKLISLANYYRGGSKTLFASVRFGNVMGSNGSVVPLFQKQITEDGPITITDKDMTRFIITMKEAIDLIFTCCNLLKGGEVFIWKMDTMRVKDLAEVMIKKYCGNKKIEEKIVGKVEGEKLHEEIMSEEEYFNAVDIGNCFVVFPLIDHVSVVRKYPNDRPIKDQAIVSNMGTYISQKKILKLLEEIENENS
jgi:UDP-N-acetylglucosamine 4,6-dehydratase/5-epimerase